MFKGEDVLLLWPLDGKNLKPKAHSKSEHCYYRNKSMVPRGGRDRLRWCFKGNAVYL